MADGWESRLSELGVSPEAIAEARMSTPPQAVEGAIRVMQYNVLADGLSSDGFLVRPVLADWPAGAGNVPTSDGDPATFSTLISEMVSARKDEGKLRELQAKYDTPAARRNLSAVTDWKARLARFRQKVQAYRPDVVVMQELDHFAQMAESLAQLGYSCKVSNAAGPYVPAHINGYSDNDTEQAELFCKAWGEKGYSFLPHLGSTCKLIALEKLGLAPKILAAAEARGLKEGIVDSKTGGLSRNWTRGLSGGSAPLLRDAGMEDPATLDDMGVAVFWRADRYVADDLKFRVFPSGGGGLVQVRLQQSGETGICRTFVVMGTHLSSGDAPDDEEKRLKNQVCPDSGLRAWALEACSADDAVILSLDANSDPTSLAPDGVSSCWRSLRSALGASVWDGYFNPEGKPIGSGEGDPPVTSNKVRGPSSGQAQKIGLHAYYLIDHIFYSPSALELQGHAYPPQRFASNVAALEAVQPSLANASDHYPVVVDFVWRPHHSAHVRIAKRKTIGSHMKAVATFLRGTSTKPPVERLVLTAVGSAIATLVEVATRVDREGLAKVDHLETASLESPSDGRIQRIAQFRVVLRNLINSSPL